MVTAITEGIRVSVETEYQEDYSDFTENHFVYIYKIQIENLSDYTVQLISREWHITNAIGEKSKVEGMGVVGKQPVLEPNQFHEYVSGCNLPTEIGKMKGSYIMNRLLDNQKIQIAIPEFILIPPYKCC